MQGIALSQDNDDDDDDEHKSQLDHPTKNVIGIYDCGSYALN